MTLRKKTLITIIITFVILFVILYITSQFILLKGFGKLEEKQANDKVKRTVNILADDISNLDDYTSDWAWWDDTYNFINDGNQNYITVNLVDETFSQLRLNLMVFINESGRIIFVKGFDLVKNQEIPAPQSLIEALSPQNPLVRHPNPKSSIRGIILLPEGPLLVASRPIVTSKGQGPIRGTLITGRYLNSSKIEHLKKIMELPITIIPFNDEHLPHDFQAARALLSKGSWITTHPISSNFFGGYALLNDIYGNPALLMEVEMPREIYKQGKITIFYFVISLLIITVVFAIISIVLLENQVISPLLLLGKSVNKIAEKGDLTNRVPVIGSDEFSVLTGQINQMLNALDQANKEKDRLETQLQRAQKMEAIGTLAGGVAHDLNNLLSGLVGYPQLLLMKIPPDSPLRESILIIQKSGEKAAAMVQDMLTLARRGTAISEVINLNDIIRTYLSSPEYGKLKSFHPNVFVETNLETNLLNILGSPIHLYKTVMNLVSNAAEAMPNGGMISIITENRHLDRPVQSFDHITEGDYVVFTISDTGTGILPEEKEKIFEPFYTKKTMGRSGTGLGMAVVWTTVKDHNGYIDIQSTEEKGTRITLYFPITRQPARDNTPVLVEEYSGKGESILIVDDVKDQRAIASLMLKKLGYSVTSVASGEEAINYLKNHSADLLILDMIMDPGIDGLETYKSIIRLHPKQKAIIASGFSETDRVKEAQRLGAGFYLKKPYLLEEIGLAVRRELDKK